MLTEEEKELVAQEPPDLSEYIKEKKPALSDFKREIDYFIDLYKKYDKEIENEKIFFHWFRINLTPFKQTLLNTICKWSNILKHHLIDETYKK